MSNPIDLGMTLPKPSAPAESDSGEQVHFPSLYVDSQEDLSQLPDEGTMTIAYTVRNRTKSESQDGARHAITIDVTQILDFEGEGAESNGNTSDDREANLDKMANEELESRKSKKDLEQD